MGTTIHNEKYEQLKNDVTRGIYKKQFNENTNKSELLRETNEKLKEIKKNEIPPVIIDLWVNPETFFDRDKISRTETEVVSRYAAEDSEFYNHLASKLPPDKFQMLLFSTASSKDRLSAASAKFLDSTLDVNQEFEFNEALENNIAQKFIYNKNLGKKLLENPHQFSLSNKEMAQLILKAPDKSPLRLQAEKLSKKSVKKNKNTFRTRFSNTWLGKLLNVKPSVIVLSLGWISELTQIESESKKDINLKSLFDSSRIDLLHTGFNLLGNQDKEKETGTLKDEYNNLKRRNSTFADSVQRLNEHKKLEKKVDLLLASFKDLAEKQQNADEKNIEDSIQQLEAGVKGLEEDIELCQIKKVASQIKDDLMKIKNNKAMPKDSLSDFNKKLEKHPSDCKKNIEQANIWIQLYKNRIKKLQQPVVEKIKLTIEKLKESEETTELKKSFEELNKKINSEDMAVVNQCYQEYLKISETAEELLNTQTQQSKQDELIKQQEEKIKRLEEQSKQYQQQSEVSQQKVESLTEKVEQSTLEVQSLQSKNVELFEKQQLNNIALEDSKKQNETLKEKNTQIEIENKKTNEKLDVMQQEANVVQQEANKVPGFTKQLEESAQQLKNLENRNLELEQQQQNVSLSLNKVIEENKQLKENIEQSQLQVEQITQQKQELEIKNTQLTKNQEENQQQVLNLQKENNSFKEENDTLTQYNGKLTEEYKCFDSEYKRVLREAEFYKKDAKTLEIKLKDLFKPIVPNHDINRHLSDTKDDGSLVFGETNNDGSEIFGKTHVNEQGGSLVFGETNNEGSEIFGKTHRDEQGGSLVFGKTNVKNERINVSGEVHEKNGDNSSIFGDTFDGLENIRGTNSVMKNNDSTRRATDMLSMQGNKQETNGKNEKLIGENDENINNGNLPEIKKSQEPSTKKQENKNILGDFNGWKNSSIVNILVNNSYQSPIKNGHNNPTSLNTEEKGSKNFSGGRGNTTFGT